MGVDHETPSMAVDQSRFWFLSHLRGRFFSPEIPCPAGPRNAGQFSPRASGAAASAAPAMIASLPRVPMVMTGS